MYSFRDYFESQERKQRGEEEPKKYSSKYIQIELSDFSTTDLKKELRRRKKPCK